MQKSIPHHPSFAFSVQACQWYEYSLGLSLLASRNRKTHYDNNLNKIDIYFFFTFMKVKGSHLGLEASSMDPDSGSNSLIVLLA